MTKTTPTCLSATLQANRRLILAITCKSVERPLLSTIPKCLHKLSGGGLHQSSPPAHGIVCDCELLIDTGWLRAGFGLPTCMPTMRTRVIHSSLCPQHGHQSAPTPTLLHPSKPSWKSLVGEKSASSHARPGTCQRPIRLNSRLSIVRSGSSRRVQLSRPLRLRRFSEQNPREQPQ